MREILFRGKRKKYGDWVFGDLTQRPTRVYIFPRADGDWQDNEVLPETVGQFTGLLDKNGKKIFEGDIVTWLRLSCDNKPATIEKAFIYFDRNWGQWRMHISCSICFDLAAMCRCNDKLKVIGNATDNPELLEDK